MEYPERVIVFEFDYIDAASDMIAIKKDRECDDEEAEYIRADIHEKEVAKLTEQIEDTNRVHRKIMEERCASDEVHCTCVPFLRAEVEKLKGALSQSNAALLVYSKGGHQ